MDPFQHGTTVKLTPSWDSALCAVNALDHLLAASLSRQGFLFHFEKQDPSSLSSGSLQSTPDFKII